MTKLKPKVAAIIVARGNSIGLKRCIKSIRKQTCSVNQFVVVDVGTTLAQNSIQTPTITDSSTQNDITFFHADFCRSFSDAINLLVESHKIEKSIEWLWVLHDDAYAEPDCLLKQINQIGYSQNLVQVGAKQLLDPGGDLLEVGFSITTSQRYFFGLMPGEMDQHQYDEREDVFGTSLNGALLRFDFVQNSKLADPVLGLIGDSQNVALKSTLMNCRTIVCPNAIIHHQQKTFRNASDSHFNLFKAQTFARYYHQLWLAKTPKRLILWLGLLFTALARAAIDFQHFGTHTIMPWTMLKHWRIISQNRKMIEPKLELKVTNVKKLLTPESTYRRFIHEKKRLQFLNETEKFQPTVLQAQALVKVRQNNWIVAGLLTLLLTLISILAFRSLLIDLWNGGNLISPVLRRTIQPWQTLFNYLIPLALPTFGVSGFFGLGTITRNLWLRSFGTLLYAFSPIALSLISSGRISGIVFYILAPIILAEIVKGIGHQRTDLDIPRRRQRWHLFAGLLLALATLTPRLVNLIMLLPNFTRQSWVVLLMDQESYSPNYSISTSDLLAFLPQPLLETNFKLILFIAIGVLVLSIFLRPDLWNLIGAIVTMSVWLLAWVIKDQVVNLLPNQQPVFANVSPYLTIVWLLLLVLSLRGLDYLNKIWLRKGLSLVFASVTGSVIAISCITFYSALSLQAQQADTIQSIAYEQQLQSDFPNILVIEQPSSELIEYSILGHRNLDYFGVFPYQLVEQNQNSPDTEYLELQSTLSQLLTGHADASTKKVFQNHRIGGIEIPASMSGSPYYIQLVANLNQAQGLKPLTSGDQFAYWSLDYAAFDQEIS
ncbi:MAG: hypothetical protein LBC43_01495 [Bifidobacteriaceae bacterium]|jgi:GT2 family glycosyltransferase|nr:hypothetical protein [Bifidobacteriaceae bacterium]